MGCNTATLNLTITPLTTTGSITTSICAGSSYTWPANNVTYTTAQSGTTYVTACNTATLNLTITPLTTTGSVTTSICAGDSYTWPANGVTYTTAQSGTTYVSGCNTATLNLTITQPICTISDFIFGLDLIASAVGGVPAYSYEWNTSETTQQITPTTNGWYWCIVTDFNGCIGDTAFYNVNLTGIADFGINDLKIYPNPSRDIFNISFTSETVQDLKVRVLNVVGEEIILEDLQQFVGEYTKQINLQDNAKGIYFLEIETDEVIINKKLILQ